MAKERTLRNESSKRPKVDYGWKMEYIKTKSWFIKVIGAGVAILISVVIYRYKDVIEDSLPMFNSGSQDTVEGNETGGWREADEKTEKRYGSYFCNIDILFNYEVSVKMFEEQYRNKRPLIVMFEEGPSGWTDPVKWTVDSLKHEYGGWEVVSGNAREIVRRGGSGYVTSSFDRFIDATMNDVDSVGEPFYIFDRNFYKDSSLPQTIRPPEYLRIQNDADDSIFFLGASGSGVSFHKHAEAWNGVIYGKKRWFLYPIEKTPPGGVYPGRTQTDWLTSIYPNLSPEDRPLECVQHAGDILYLPEGMYHGTINLGDTVALGIQKKAASTPAEKLFYEENALTRQIAIEGDDKKRRTMLKEKLEIIEKLHEILPDSTDVLARLGTVHRDLGFLDKALSFTLAAIEKDQTFVMAILNLASMQAQMGMAVQAEQLYMRAREMTPDLWDVYAQYGDFLMNQGRSAEAIDVYKKGTELEPNQPAFWHQMLLAKERVGDKKGAQETISEIRRRFKRQQMQ